jgi:L-rhamnose isomerase
VDGTHGSIYIDENDYLSAHDKILDRWDVKPILASRRRKS